MSAYDKFKQYETLLAHILTNEDREKFEQFVGQVRARGPKATLMIVGPIASGKSTLVKIAQGVLKDMPEVAYHHDGFDSLFDSSPYVLVAALKRPDFDVPGSVVINTTGRMLPEDMYHDTMQSIADIPGLISLRCADRNIASTRNYQEN